MELLKQLSEIQQKLNVPKNQYNSFGGYNFRSCEDILNALKPLLNGLILTLNDDLVFLTSQKEAETDEPTTDDFYHVGTICKIKQMIKEISVN